MTTTVLICHQDAPLDHEGLARWLASFTELVGLVVIREQPGQYWRRAQRELKRAGLFGFADVLAFRLHSSLFLSKRDAQWEQEQLQRLRGSYPPLRPDLPQLVTHTPNSEACEAFLRKLAPELVLARCKFIMKERIFSIPRLGTWVMHPGICPEYRNAHGCFWALAERDLDRVGMSLLRIDADVDTGPVYGYYSYPYDELNESPRVIQHRVVLENLAALATKIKEVAAGAASPLDTKGRRSAVWGQPRLTRYWQWKLAARRDHHASH